MRLCIPSVIAALLVGHLVFAQTKQAIPPRNPVQGAVSSNDIGYRIGVIEAKIEASNSAIAEVKASVKELGDRVLLASAKLDSVETRLSWLTGILAFVATLLTTDFVKGIRQKWEAEWVVRKPSQVAPQPPPSDDVFQNRLASIQTQIRALTEEAASISAARQSTRGRAEEAASEKQS